MGDNLLRRAENAASESDLGMKQSAAELMDLAKEKSGERRRELMHRVADMYFQFGPRIDDPELALFDDVLSQLAQEMESRVRAELANRMALARTPPVRLIRTLARDEIIDVASPILQLSRAVSEEDLIDLARTGYDFAFVGGELRGRLRGALERWCAARGL